MNRWWRKRSLRLRLTLWYAAASFVILLALGVLLLTSVRGRLGAQLDQQLQNDFAFVAARLEHDNAGRVRLDYEREEEQDRHPKSDGDENDRMLSAAWFEVWSPGNELLLRRRPGEEDLRRLGPPLARPAPESDRRTPHFFSTEMGSMPVRALECGTHVDNNVVTLRVIRSEADLRSALAQIDAGLAFGMPLAVILSGAGGYLIARRSLAPVGEMAAQARQITATSLNQRLPVPNPHDELGRLATVFNETLARLENSFAELRRFAADASHELRTPLTALRAVGEASLREEDGDSTPGEWREAVGSMLEEAQRLGELVEALLLLARADSSANASPTLEAVALGPLLIEVRESLLALAEENEQRIEIEADPRQSNVVARADSALLRRALLNLLHNAIRYSPRKTAIRLRFAERKERGGWSALIEVADEGPGIDPEHQEKVFQRFYRIDPARSREESSKGGAGLGLAIARWSIERQGGHVGLESAPGAGSIFRVILPSARD
jgi:heavy metal sensor kinase